MVYIYGKSKLCFLDKRTKAVKYKKKFREGPLIFAALNQRVKWVFQQDNASIRRALLKWRYFHDN